MHLPRILVESSLNDLHLTRCLAVREGDEVAEGVIYIMGKITKENATEDGKLLLVCRRV